MRGRRVRIHRLQQLLVAFAAVGMLIGVRPASAVRGRLHLKTAAVTAIIPTDADAALGCPFESANPEAALAEGLALTDRDEDETDVESVDGLELERSVVVRTAPARSRTVVLSHSPPEAVPPARPGRLRPIAAPAIPVGLPTFLCRLTC